jgi:Zn-dependent protease with chaperone function
MKPPKQYIVLKNLDSTEYEHPFDRQALDALQKVPFFDKVVKAFSEYGIEKVLLTQYTGNNVKITKESYPKTFKYLDYVCRILEEPNVPDFYCDRGADINGLTVGVIHPIMVLTSYTVDALDEDELIYIIGHEVGHIKSKHVLYYQMASFFPVIADFIATYTLKLGSIITKPIELALLHWKRMSEFTADRAGLLACQDIEAAISVMMKTAGLPKMYFDNVKANRKLNIMPFLQQAKAFEQLDYEGYSRIIKILVTLNETHPWMVSRAAELIKWYESGAYTRVIQRLTKIEQDIFCNKCGEQIFKHTKFCPKNGQEITNCLN